MRVPKYRKNGDGRAFVEYRNRRYYLGRHGTAESLAAYKDFVGRLFQQPTEVVESSRMTVAQAAEHYLRYAEAYYSQDGRPTQEFVNVRAAVADLVTLFGPKPASALGPTSILTMQTQLVGAGYARSTINSRVSRVKRCLRWCASRELIPRSTIEAIWTVDGLRRGRTEAVEPEPVRPIAAYHVKTTLPFLSPVVAAMVQVQYLCGMRPAEVCAMRLCDLDMTERIWIYRPRQHKNQWRGKALIKAVPVEAQEIMRPFFKPDVSAPLFSSTESKAWWAARRIRKTTVFPCELRRRDQSRRRNGNVVTQDRAFSTGTYGKAILDGVIRAAKAGVEIPEWSPNQLRHAIGTELSQRLGQQAAQRWLGHARLETTSIYAELQTRELIEIAGKLEASPRRTAE